jgi:thiol-disulfide isomerase/thioredoxin
MARSWSGWAAKSFALIGVAAALYVMPACSFKPGGALRGLAVGDMKSLVVEEHPSPAPDVAFTDAAGKPHTLADFKGKVVVLNLWATWCAPCVAEMPTLARLDAETVGQPVAVVPVSLDRVEDRANAEAFIAKRPPLGFYAEPRYALPFAFKPPVDGLPTTLLIGPDGVVRARLSGGADWSGAQARKVIEALATSH